MGPQHYSAMFKQVEIAKRVFDSNGGTLLNDNPTQRSRRPQPYWLMVPEEPLRYLLPPRICNVIMVPAEIRCSHTWPAGVNRSMLVEHIMPKIDSAAPEHIVWSEKFLDDYSLLTESATAAWGCSSSIARAIGKGTMVLSTWLPDGTGNQLVLRNVFYMPDLRINLISVP